MCPSPDRDDSREHCTGTADPGYTARLVSGGGARWKRALDVQRPYRIHIKHCCSGRVLDVGCGIGRNLEHLGGRGVGVDHNAASVAVARTRGLDAYTPDEFEAATGSFDTLLAAHLVEHLTEEDARQVLRRYLGFVRPGGRVVIITPQERGYRTDPTHVRWVDFSVASAMLEDIGVSTRRQYSFPFPRFAGRLFTYNEFVTIGIA